MRKGVDVVKREEVDSLRNYTVIFHSGRCNLTEREITLYAHVMSISVKARSSPAFGV
jgi:hypothetical protein